MKQQMLTSLDLFHYHLKKANEHLKEESFLKFTEEKDKKEAKRKAWKIDIYLDKIRSTHNIGSIFRTCEALQLGRIVSSSSFIDFEHSQIKKTAMGAWDWVEWEKINNLEELKRPIIALETCSNANSLYDYIFPESFSLVLGNEEYGVSKKILEQADDVIYIPMEGRKNSLNVANAFSMVAGEIVRQRSRVKVWN